MDPVKTVEIELISLEDPEAENETTKEIVNWENTCRVCATGSDHMIPIYENEGAEHKLIDKIDRYLPIEVSATDSLPLKLCFHCASTLLAWHDLISGCLEAEEKLLQILSEIQPKKQSQLSHRQILSSNGIVEEIMVEDGPSDIHHSISNARMENSSPVANEWKCIDVSNPNELAEENVAVNDDSESIITENIGVSNVVHQDTETILICDQEKSYPTQLLEETSENVRRSTFVYKIRERCGATEQKKSTAFSMKQNNVSQRNGKNLAHAEVSDHRTSGISDEKWKTTTLKKTTDSLQKNKEFSCEKCCRRFLRESNLKTHERNCQGERKTKKSTFSSKRSHGKEVEQANNEENAKKSCIVEVAKADDGNSRGDSEIPKKMEPPSYPCFHCDFTLQTEKLFHQHMRDHHSEVLESEERKNQRKINRNLVRRAKMEANGRVYYHCNECGKNLFATCTFIRHMRIHTGERPFVCHQCGKQFRISQGLINHLRDYHEGIKKFACDICGRMFSTKQYVESHRRIHTGERPFVCDICGKTFKQKSSLSLHCRTHSDVFPFNCDHCGQKFRSKPPLEIHLSTHTGEKPYTCDICNRAFRIQYDMKKHRLIHSDEKPWKCSDCGLAFRQKRYLVNHKRIKRKCDSTKKKLALAAKHE